MRERYTEHMKENSQALRRNMTKEERHLWYDFLKTLPVTVNRQKIFGKYIADFFCAKAKLVIELDGSQHYEDAALAYDAQRDLYFKNMGITVLRYSNYDISTKFDVVCKDIYNHIFPQESLTELK